MRLRERLWLRLRLRLRERLRQRLGNFAAGIGLGVQPTSFAILALVAAPGFNDGQKPFGVDVVDRSAAVSSHAPLRGEVGFGHGDKPVDGLLLVVDLGG